MPEHTSAATDDTASKVRAVVQAARAYPVVQSESWDSVRQLSELAELDGTGVDSDGVLLDAGGGFRGVMDVYVRLKYAELGKEPIEASDAFLGHFKGHFRGSEAVIESMLIDTSAFFEGEASAA